MKRKRNIFRSIAEVIKMHGARTAIVTAVLAVALCSAGTSARAASLGALVSFDIPSLLSVRWLDAGDYVVVPLVPSDVATGEKKQYGGSFVVNSGTMFTIDVSAADNYFNGGNGQKLISDLEVEIDNNGIYIPIPGTNRARIYMNNSPENDTVHLLEYRLALSPNDTAGTYSTTLIYTVTPAM